jgi:NAD(P)-dependent dehydrogenase (short-subunit alcohol dehydrogenase family)
MGKLDGKVVIVTGASRGIGESIAKLFAAEGGKVVCAARTLREGDHQLAGSLETTVDAIRVAGGEATAVAANISVPEECEALVQAARDTYGPVDILVNNAALMYPVATKDYQINRLMRTWAVNVHGPFILSQLVLQDMIERGSGSIVSISSGAATGPGRGPYPGATGSSSAYGMQKAALERFTQGLAQEVYQYGISVTAFSPSQFVPTVGSMFAQQRREVDPETTESPETMAKAALLLASEPLDKVTGRVTYSQQILNEFGWITDAKGTGVDPERMGSGYSRI